MVRHELGQTLGASKGQRMLDAAVHGSHTESNKT